MAPSFDTVGWFSNNINIFQKVGDVLLNINDTTKDNFKSYVVAEDLVELADQNVQKLFYQYLEKYLPKLERIEVSKKCQ